MFRPGRALAHLEQGDESFLQHVFGLAVREPKGAAVHDQLGRLGFVERFAPARLFIVGHNGSLHSIDTLPAKFV